MASAGVSVLFVCLGNICRSPTAHGVFEHKVTERGLSGLIRTDSAGTGDWHIGHAPDPRATQAALARGYDLSPLRARQVTPDDFHRFDYVMAMDGNNLRDLQQMAPAGHDAVLDLLLAYSAQTRLQEVPDPYYGEDDGFAEVLDLIECACNGLLDDIERSLAR